MKQFAQGLDCSGLTINSAQRRKEYLNSIVGKVDALD
jgi:hypothetical protein